MFSKTTARAFVLAALLAGGAILVASRTHKSTEDPVCSDSQEQCDKPQAHGEFIILEALNRAVMATAR